MKSGETTRINYGSALCDEWRKFNMPLGVFKIDIQKRWDAYNQRWYKERHYTILGGVNISIIKSLPDRYVRQINSVSTKVNK